MKTLLSFFLLFLAYSSLLAQQSPDFLTSGWNQSYNKESNEEAQLLIDNLGDGYIVIGNRNEYGKNRDVIVRKTDKAGNLLFEKILTDKEDQDIYSGLVNEKQEIILLGTTWSQGNGKGDIWLVKMDQNGNKLWDITFGGKDWESGQHITQLDDHKYLISGYTSSKGKGHRDIWLLMINEEGEKVWETTIGGIQFDFPAASLQTQDGYWIAANTESYGNGGYDFWLIKTDKKGSVVWDKTFGGSKWDICNQLIAGHEGLLLGGRTDSKGNGSSDVWLIFLDVQGNVIWEKTYGTTRKEKLNSICVTPQGFFLTATSYDITTDHSFIWCLRLDKDGNVLNAQEFDNLNRQQARMAHMTDSEDLIFLSDFIHPLDEKKHLLLSRYNMDPVLKLQEYINYHIQTWQQKGTYEKVSEYRMRVNQKSREQKIKELARQAVGKYASEPFEKARQNATLQYDVEGEVFKISLPDLNNIYVEVPVHEAETFDDHFHQMTFSSKSFSVKDGNFVLTKADLYDPNNKKTYTYDINKPVTFQSVEIKNQFEPIDKILASNLWDLPDPARSKNTEYFIGKSDVDSNIPVKGGKKPNTFALVIGNEDYSHYQKGLDRENDVPFAANDANVFSQYLNKTLGVPKENISLLINATAGQMKKELERMSELAAVNGPSTELIVYYAGHGLPDEKSREAYIIPVDINGSNLKYAIKIDEIYRQLTKNPAKRVLVFFDACFSGGARKGALMARRGVRIKPKPYQIKGNLLVLASSSGDESSGAYPEQQHGMFTYFLLKKLKQSQGDISLGELSAYLKKQVQLKSLLINESVQTPQVNISPAIQNEWADWNLSAPQE